MNIVKWIIQDRVILLCGVGDQTLDSIEDITNQLTNLMNEGVSPVHIVIDNRHVGHVPRNIKLIGKFMKKHENSGFTVAIGGNQLIKFISKMLAKIADSDMLIFKDSPEEALSLLQKLDQSLPQEVELMEA